MTLETAQSLPSADARMAGASVRGGPRAQRYRAFLSWMRSDAFWRFRWLVLGIVSTGFAALGLQVKAIALTIYYTHLFEDDKTLHLLGRAFVVRESIPLLVGFGMVVLLTLAVSGALQYASRVWTLRFRRRYAEVCSVRVLEVLRGAPHTVPAGPVRFDDATATALARSESLYCGRMASIAVGVFTPAISFVAAVAVLFYIHWPLTLLLVAMIGVCGIFLYRTNVYGAAQSHLAEKLSRGAIAEYRRLVQRHRSSFADADGDEPTPTEVVTGPGPIRSHLDAYMARLRVVADSELIGNIFLGVVLATLLVALGSAAIRRDIEWERMIAYLVALRYALVTFRGGVRTITSFNRFYPQVVRYFDFARASNFAGGTVEPRVALPETFALRAPSPVLPGSLREFTIANGARIALCAPIDLNRYTLPFIIRNLLGDGAPLVRAIVEESAWITSGIRLPAGPLGRGLGYTDEMWRALESLAEQAGLRRKMAEQLPLGAQSQIPEEGRDGVNPGLKFLLLLLAVLRVETRWIFLDANDLAVLDERAQRQVMDLLAGRIVVILYEESVADAGNFGEQIAAVQDAQTQIGLGSISWLKSQQAVVDKILTDAVPNRKARVEEDDEDDDDSDGV